MGLLRTTVGNLRAFLGLYSLVTGGMAILALVVSFLIFVFLPELENTAQVLLGVAAVLLAVYLVGAYSDVKSSMLARQTRYGTNTAVMVLAFVGMITVVNYISAQNHTRIDVTTGGQYTLSRQTITVLRNLQDSVKVTGFFTKVPEAQAGRDQAENLLTEYRFQSNKISFEFIDPEEKLSIARQYEVTSDGTLVFESGGRRKQLFGIGEQEFTGAILNVTGTLQPKVYYLVGHGEPDPDSNDSAAISLAKQGILSDNYQVFPLNLVSSDKVPDDASLVIVASPKRTFLDREIGLMNDYLDRGGKALFTLDPNPLPEIKNILARWGVKVNDGTVVDQAAFAQPDVQSPAVLGNQYAFHQITKELGGSQATASFFPGAAGLDINVPKDDQDHVTVTPLAMTTSQSFLVTDKDRLTFDAAKDLRGPLPLVLVVEATKPIGQRPPRAAHPDGTQSQSVKQTRIVVFPDTDFITNLYFYSVGNGDFFLNSVNWLGAQEELISIRPKPSESRRLVITQRTWNFIFYSTIAFWPLAVLLVGGVVWWRRR